MCASNAENVPVSNKHTIWLLDDGKRIEAGIEGRPGSIVGRDRYSLIGELIEDNQDIFGIKIAYDKI